MSDQNNYGDNIELDRTKFKYVIYARKSSEDEQGQKNSIKDQIKECRQYAEIHQLNVVATIEESKSAKIANHRPRFNAMLADFKKGVYDGILAWHPDRLARNMLEAGIIIDMVDRNEIKDLQFNQFQFDHNAAGKMMLGMLFVFSKQYSDSLSERINRGERNNLDRGILGGTKKWGYRRDEDSGFYEPDENFEFIQQAWHMRIYDKKGCPEIKQYLHSKNVKRKVKARNRYETIKSTSSLSNMFKDPFYYGAPIQRDKTVHLSEHYDFKPMITEEEYNMTQQIGYIKNKNLAAIKGHERIFKPLVGMVYCAVCHSSTPMSVTRSMPRDKSGYMLYFTCSNKACPRKPKNIQAHYVWDQIIEIFDNLHLDEDAYNLYSQQINQFTAKKLGELRNERKSNNSIITSLRKQLDDQSVALENATSEALKDAINKKADGVGIRINQLQDKNRAIEKKLAKADMIPLSRDRFLNLVKKLGYKMRETNAWQADQMCRQIFSNLYLDDKKRLTYRCKEPFDSLIKLSKNNMVETIGLEPTTSAMRMLRSTR